MTICTPYNLISANSNNATLIRTGPCWVRGLIITNTNAAIRYLKFYDKATTPVPGTDTPFRRIGIPPTSTVVWQPNYDLPFTNGLGFGMVTGAADSDNTSVGANDLMLGLDYI